MFFGIADPTFVPKFLILDSKSVTGFVLDPTKMAKKKKRKRKKEKKKEKKRVGHSPLGGLSSSPQVALAI